MAELFRTPKKKADNRPLSERPMPIDTSKLTEALALISQMAEQAGVSRSDIAGELKSIRDDIIRLKELIASTESSQSSIVTELSQEQKGATSKISSDLNALASKVQELAVRVSELFDKAQADTTKEGLDSIKKLIDSLRKDIEWLLEEIDRLGEELKKVVELQGSVAYSGTPYTDAQAKAQAEAAKLDDHADPDDNTDLDFSTSLHGLVPKGTNTGKFLKDDGTWSTPAGVGDMTKAVYDTDEDGTVDDSEKLEGSTKAEVQDHTPKAHKDSHDPDGTDPLDCAAPDTNITPEQANAEGDASTVARSDHMHYIPSGAPSELASVQAAGEGTGAAFARTDHAHQIQHSIADNHLVTVDGSPADTEYPVWTASGLDGKSLAEILTLLFASAFPENVAFILDAALSADGKWSGPCVETGVAGTTLAFGDCVYQAVADNRWELAKADAAATCVGKIGMCILAAGSDGDATTILLYGKVRADTAFPTFTAFAPVYIDAGTAGDLTSTAPSTSTNIVRPIGYGNSGDELFFCPGQVYVKVP